MTDTRDDLYATARRCLEEWERLKIRIRRPGRMTGATFESSVRALVVASCKDGADPGRALEEVVNDERLREMVVGPRGGMKPQILLEEGKGLLGRGTRGIC